MSEALAARYALAMVDIVFGANAPLSPEQAIAELRSFEGVVAEAADLRHILNSPAVSRQRKRAVIAKVAEALGMNNIIRNLLFVLVDRGRISMLGLLRKSMEQFIDASRGLARADVRSAAPLSAEEQAAITVELTRISGKQVVGNFSVDPALLGGAVARIGSTVYDGSVRGHLAALKGRLGA
jgi:F-type H+-transporting ATPase subunit delta